MDKNVDRLFSWLVLSYHIIQLKAIEIGQIDCSNQQIVTKFDLHLYGRRYNTVQYNLEDTEQSSYLHKPFITFNMVLTSLSYSKCCHYVLHIQRPTYVPFN